MLYQRTQGVLETAIGDGLVVLSPELRFYELNESAQVAWQETVQPCDHDAIATALTAAFDVSDKEARQAALDVIDWLQEAGLLEAVTTSDANG